MARYGMPVLNGSRRVGLRTSRRHAMQVLFFLGILQWTLPASTTGMILNGTSANGTALKSPCWKEVGEGGRDWRGFGLYYDLCSYDPFIYGPCNYGIGGEFAFRVVS